MLLELDDIQCRVQKLMDELGIRFLGRTLTSLGWSFAFDQARRRMGVCVYRSEPPVTKQIRLSAPLTRLNGWETMQDVARHEIAHALDFESRGKSNHDRYWKQWARRCGADPTRLHDVETLALAAAPYWGVCPACGVSHPFYRKPKRTHACPTCCARHNRGKFTQRFKLVVEQREATDAQRGM